MVKESIPPKWSIKHDCCTQCGGIEYKHAARGLCASCYHRTAKPSRKSDPRTAHVITEDLVRGYAQGLSSTTLAIKYNTGRSTVLSRLREAGMRIRRPFEWEEKRICIPPGSFTLFREVIDGLLLGDGSINRHGSLRIEQATVRLEWLEDIKNQLSDLGVNSKLKVFDRKSSRTKSGRWKGGILHTPCYQELKEERLRWYPKNKKAVPQDVTITTLSTALWICGDGTGNKAGYLTLCTNSFTEADVRRLMSLLKDTFKVHPKIAWSGNGEPTIGLFRKDEVVVLRDVVLPLMSECCHYKFQYARPAQKKGPLNQEAVTDIRQRYDNGELLQNMAEDYGVSRTAINNIGLRRSYKWVL